MSLEIPAAGMTDRGRVDCPSQLSPLTTAAAAGIRRRVLHWFFIGGGAAAGCRGSAGGRGGAGRVVRLRRAVAARLTRG